MAWGICRTQGGGMTKKLLWENANPTATFSNQTITLSESIQNFDYVLFEFEESITNTIKHIVMYPVDIFKAYGTGTYIKHSLPISVSNYYGNMVGYAVAVEGTITNALALSLYTLNASALSVFSNGVPTRVYGITGKIRGID